MRREGKALSSHIQTPTPLNPRTAQDHTSRHTIPQGNGHRSSCNFHQKNALSCHTWIKEDALPTSTCFCQFLAQHAATTLRIFTSGPPFIKLPHVNPPLSPLTLITESPFPQLNDAMNLNSSPNLYSSSPELKAD